MREIGVFVFAASIAIPSASMSGDAGSQIAAAACFWGTTLATVQLVEKLCPDFEPSDSAEDALSIMREHTEFIRCHKVRKQKLLKDRDNVKSDVPTFCREAVALKGVTGDNVFQPRVRVSQFTKESTLRDWLHAPQSVRWTFAERVGPVVARRGESAAQMTEFLIGCLDGMSKPDNTALAGANRVVNNMKINEAAALCSLSKAQ